MDLYRHVLVLGGARSGKSRYAQTLAEASNLSLVFVATAQAHDEEMRLRIAAHRQDRRGSWRVIEQPLALAPVLADDTGPDRVVLVDCLTLWLSNVLLAGSDVEAATAELTEAIRASAGPLILVSNEVGNGVVPPTSLGRDFRDAQGRLNQAVASACDAVVLVTAGCPQRLKPSPSFSLALR